MSFVSKLSVGQKYYHAGIKASYIVLAVNPWLDRVLMISSDSDSFNKIVGAWGITPTDGWSQGHYFMNNLDAGLKWVHGEDKKEEKKRWLFVFNAKVEHFEYGVQDTVHCIVAQNYEDAQDKFETIYSNGEWKILDVDCTERNIIEA